MAKNYPETLDGRYFVSRSQLWRKTNPELDDSHRRKLIKQMMQARRAIQLAQTEADIAVAKDHVKEAKIALGESGPVWWQDGAPDESGKHPKNSNYADWWNALTIEDRKLGE